MTEYGKLTKQNLVLTIYDLTREEVDNFVRGTFTNPKLFYKAEFQDDSDLFTRVKETARIFDGTHSRRTNDYRDDASFRITDKDKIIEYIERLKAPTFAPGDF